MARMFSAGGNDFTVTNYNRDGTLNLYRSDGIPMQNVRQSDFTSLGISPEMINAVWNAPKAGDLTPTFHNQIFGNDGNYNWTPQPGYTPPQMYTPSLSDIFSAGPQTSSASNFAPVGGNYQGVDMHTPIYTVPPNETSVPLNPGGNNNQGNGLTSMFNNQDQFNPNNAYQWGYYMDRS